MQTPLQITFRQMSTSAALSARIRALTAKLERYSDRIVTCHVIVGQDPHPLQSGALFHCHIDLTLPGKQIVVSHAHANDPAHTNPYTAVRDAFRAARRSLEIYERTQRHAVKAHSLPQPPLLPAAGE